MELKYLQVILAKLIYHLINDKEGNEIYRNNLDEKYRDAILDIDYLSVSDLIHINIYSDNRWFLTDNIRKVNPFEEDPSYMYEIAS